MLEKSEYKKRGAHSLVTARYWVLSKREGENKELIEGGRRVENHTRRDGLRAKFSVISIAYNNEKTISRCIASVVNQSFRDFEYIIVDGGSKDGTLDILRSHSSLIDYYASEADTGIYNAINKALSLAHGRYILLVHADDFIRHDSLEAASAVIDETQCDIALGDALYIDKNGFPAAYKPARDYGEETVLRGIIGPHESAFVSSRVYNRMGGYDESYRIAADHKFFRNSVLNGFKFVRIGRVISYKELGGESFSKDKEIAENGRLLREIFPSISEADISVLYNLKNFRELSGDSCQELYSSLRKRADLPARYLRILSMSLLRIMMGDGLTQAGVEERKARISYYLSPQKGDSIVLCVKKIKGIAGGAERVLIDLANHLVSRGRNVIVACADGVTGFPFYRLNEGVRFVDIKEPPVKEEFDSLVGAGFEKLRTDLEQVIDKSPEEFLKVASVPREIREECNGWGSLINHPFFLNWSAEACREMLKMEIPAWIRRYGGDVMRWRLFFDRVKPQVIMPFMISCIQQVFLAHRGGSYRLLLSNHNNSLRDYYGQDEWDSSGIDRLLRFYSVSSAEKSHWLLDEYVKYLPPLCRRNAVVIQNPIAVPESKPLYQPRNKIILGVGRLTEVKNFQLLVRAFARIAGSVKGWKVRIFGEGPERYALDGLIEELGLKGRVEIMAPVRSLDCEYENAAIFVSCSLVEGFPLTLCEAMSAGIPCIGRKQCSGVNGLIQDCKNGFLIFEEGEKEVAILADKLLELIRNDKLRESMSEAAWNSVKPFSSGNVFAKWDSVIDPMLAQLS